MELYEAIQAASATAREGTLQRLALATALEHAVPIEQSNANDATDEPDIPAVQPRPDDRSSRDSSRGRDGAGAREGGRPSRSGEDEAPRGAKAAKRSKPEWSVARLWVGAGRKLKMRPGDLVGAIANEVGIDASVIGAIQIADGYSTVEVPEEIAEDIITALRNTTIKGKKVLVRRDRMR